MARASACARRCRPSRSVSVLAMFAAPRPRRRVPRPGARPRRRRPGATAASCAASTASPRGSPVSPSAVRCPTYLATILVVLVLLPGGVLVAARRAARATSGSGTRPLQLVVAVLALACAITAARVRERLTAVAPRRRHRVRRRRALRPAGRPRPRAHPVPRRVADPRRLRARAAQAARRTSSTGTPRRERLARLLIAVPAGLLMAGMGAVAIGVRTARRCRRRSPHARLRVRRRSQRRQRHARRHPRLGHARRDLGAGRGRHRRRQPGLPAPAHRRDPRDRRGARPGASTPSATRAAPSPTRAAAGCAARALADPDQRSLVLEFIARLTFHTMLRAVAVPAVRGPQRARRRLRRRPGRRTRARRPLPRGRPLRAR